ncbi:MAG: DUF4380 domain-containing protein [Methylacidiphilales bacterium]|nr:DUF4380 domain-containing protein [Candidatus Methylacidiphilales bacterium]
MIQEVPYAGWKRNLRLQGQNTELIITLDVGPRIIRYAFHGERNVFVEMPEQLGGSGEKEWMIRGGHRFWTAPEAAHSYELDNRPVEWTKAGESGVEITQPASPFGFQKTLRVELGKGKEEIVRVTHLLKNTGGKPLEVTPWALSVMAPGGMALIPQPYLDFHPSEFPEGRVTKPQDFLPNRELILWPFTNLTDGRYAFSEHFLRVSHHPERPATKIGLKLPTGWIAYHNGDYAFAKHFAYDPALPYPDRGSNFELFTNVKILELETLASSLPLEPGATREHVEHWVLRKITDDLRREKAANDFFAALPKIG